MTSSLLDDITELSRRLQEAQGENDRLREVLNGILFAWDRFEAEDYESVRVEQAIRIARAALSGSGT